jgi:glycosyltransferase involved in cell wall biosynthesis
MRIGILTQYYPPEMGAPQGRLSELAGSLAERGHEVYVLTAMPNYPQGKIHPGYGGALKRERLDNCNVIRTYVYPATGIGWRRLLNYLSFTISSSLFGAFLLPRMDYLITESPPLFLGMSGYLLSRLKHARMVFNVSDLWPDSAVDLGAVDEGWALRAARALEGFCYRKAWCVSGQSKEILARIREGHPKTNLYHLSNGVNPEEFGPEQRSPGMRTTLAPGKSTIVVYAGLHGYAQGLQYALEAALELRDIEDLAVVLVGDGPEKRQLVEWAQSHDATNVRFLDAVPRREMPSVVASADIALIPLKKRIFGAVPSKLYEAMGAGVPVVLMTGGEAEGIVNDAQAGIVVTPGDVSALASAIRRLAASPAVREAMGDSARKAAIAHYDRKSICAHFIDLLEKELR